jgi:hypothetical protein
LCIAINEELGDPKEVVDFSRLGLKSSRHIVAKGDEMAKLDDVAKVTQDNDVAKSDRTKAAVMTKDFDIIEDAGNGHLDAGNGQLDAVTMDATSYMTIFQAIVAEATDYTKKSVETRLACVEKLLGAKALEPVIQIQSEYAKTSYAAFVAQAFKMGELYSDLAKAGFKPMERAIASMQGTKL